MDEDPQAGDGGERTVPDRYRSVVEAVRDGVFVIDLDGTITYVNEPVESVTGLDREALVGETFETLVESELFEQGAYERFGRAVDAVASGATESRQLTVETARTEERVMDVRLSRHARAEGGDDIVGVVRDVTEREQRARDAERKQEALSKLYDVGADTGLSFEEKVRRILAIGCQYLDLPYGFLTRVEGGQQEVVHAVGNHEQLLPESSAPLEETYCRKTVERDGTVGMQDAETELGTDDPAYERFGLGCYIGTTVIVGEQTYGTFCFAASRTREREFSEDEREVIELLGQWTGHALERRRFAKRLRKLHQVAQRLLVAETPDDVAATAVRSGRELLGRSVTTYLEYDRTEELLEPLAETGDAASVLEEGPAVGRGEALVWESFDSGEVKRYDDVREQAAVYDPETELRAEIHVPCGNQGVLVSAATERRAFDELDAESLRLLGRLVTVAMTAAKREQRLVERGEGLQRQNERLDEFTQVVAHDLRNPLTGAVGHLEIARKTGKSEPLDRVERSLERMDELIDELLEVARGDRQPVNIRTLSLQSAVEEAWLYVETPDATLSVEGELGEVEADETRLLQLLGNLFANSVEHAGEDVVVEVGRLDEGDGFYVVDDGPGLTEETRTAVQGFEDGTQISDTGIGLTSVADVVEAHDWTLSVPDTDRGVRFEIRTGERGD